MDTASLPLAAYIYNAGGGEFCLQASLVRAQFAIECGEIRYTIKALFDENRNFFDLNN